MGIFFLLHSGKTQSGVMCHLIIVTSQLHEKLPTKGMFLIVSMSK